MNNYETNFPAEQPPEGQQWQGAPAYQPQSSVPPQPPRPPRARNRRRWLITGGITAALLLAMGVGVGLSANGLTAQASALQANVASLNWNGNSGPGYGHGPGQEQGEGLTVTSVSGNTITATRPSGSSVVVKVTSSTVYTRAEKTISLSDIKAGDVIHAIGTRNSDGSITATRVEIELPHYDGQVKSVSGSTITIQDTDGTHVIHTSGSTAVVKAGQTVSLSDIAVGSQIVAEGTKNSDGSLNAEAIRVVLPSAGGLIQSISGSTITVSDPRDSGVTKVNVTSSTKYVTVTVGTSGATQTAASFSDLKVGVHIRVEGTKASDGSMTADVVYIMPNAPAGFGGHMGGHGHMSGDRDGDGMQFGRPGSTSATSN